MKRNKGRNDENNNSRKFPKTESLGLKTERAYQVSELRWK